MVNLGQKTAVFGAWNQVTKKKYHQNLTKSAWNYFGFKKKVSWNHYGFKGKPLIFFCWRFRWNSDKKWWFHVLLWSKNLKPVVVSLKPGLFWWSWGRRPQLHQKNLCFNEYHHRFSSSYLQSNTWIPSFFCPSFIEYRQQNKKKYERVSFEIIH